VDSLGYLSLDGMLRAAGGDPSDFCHACFSGDYPTDIPEDLDGRATPRRSSPLSPVDPPCRRSSGGCMPSATAAPTARRLCATSWAAREPASPKWRTWASSPPGFTISAKLCITYLEQGTFPDDLREEVDRHLKQLERASRRGSATPQSPARFGALRRGGVDAGMMETILNLG